jgi:hypothetical protein
VTVVRHALQGLPDSFAPPYQSPRTGDIEGHLKNYPNQTDAMRQLSSIRLVHLRPQARERPDHVLRIILQFSVQQDTCLAFPVHRSQR